MRKKLLLICILLVAAAVFMAGCMQRGSAQPVDVDPKIVTANNEFGCKLFQELYRQEDPGNNIFVSPASISLALSMTYNGAAGDTASAMAGTLDFGGMDLETVNTGNRDLIRSLNNRGNGVNIAVANSLWIREGYQLKEDFLQRNKDYYNAETETLDFSDPAAKDTINSWVSDKTHGRIEKIIDQIGPEKVLYLINAVYFKGNWAQEFDPKNTYPTAFYYPGGQGEVAMMHQTALFPYYETDQIQGIELPYGDGNTSMFVILPREQYSLTELVEQLNPGNWESWLKGFSEMEVAVHLPRVKVEYDKFLNDALINTGMEIAFGPGADFSAMSPNNPYIGEVRHKTFLEVNEEGTEAAAVTEVGMEESYHEVPVFKADRPFLLAIRDNHNGTLLFLGTITNP